MSPWKSRFTCCSILPANPNFRCVIQPSSFTQRSHLPQSILRPLFSSLLGSPMVYTIADPPPSMKSHFSIPSTSAWAIVALKDHDYTIPAAVYSTSTSASSLKKDPTEIDLIKTWLLHNRLPTAIELTQDSFQSVMNSPARPLVVLAAVTPNIKDKVQERMEEIGQRWRARTQGSGMLSENGKERPIVFAWMDIGKWKDWMKSMYGIKYKGSLELDDVEVVVTDHKVSHPHFLSAYFIYILLPCSKGTRLLRHRPCWVAHQIDLIAKRVLYA